MTLKGLLAAGGNDGSGVAVAVRTADGRVHREASGQARPPDVPFTTDTVSYLGSLAKQMVGVLTAMSVREGRLDLGASVREWLPELPGWATDVRIRHLLHHTGGLPGDSELRERMGGPPRWDSPTVLLALTDCREPTFPPGSRFLYCNAGYICLATALERLTKTPFPILARERLFEPLQMANSRFCDHEDSVPAGAAVGVPAVGESEAWPAPLSLGDGGAWSTVEDLLRWNDALLPGGAFDDQVRTLVHTPGRLDDGRPVDYAWGVRVGYRNGDLMHGHGGNWPGWTAKAVRFPDLGLVITALSNDGDVPRMVELTDRVIDHYLPKPGVTTGTEGTSRRA